VLGPNVVVIENIKKNVHYKEPDLVWYEITLADRTRALKELSNYIGLTREESGSASSFIVNLHMNEEEKKEAKTYQIKEYKDIVND
jgi:hypothetical protein